MTQRHPISPPEELVEEWGQNVRIDYSDMHWGYEQILCAMAARWGADQELEACCKWLPKLPPWSADDLRRHRRPKPLSLKAQALEALEVIPKLVGFESERDAIHRALEALDD